MPGPAALLLACSLLLPTHALATVLPNFGLHESDGEPASLAGQIGKGQWTLVMFWAMQCPICRQQEPLMSDFHRQHQGRDAHVIGISIDGMEKQEEIHRFLQEHPVSFPRYIGSLTLIAANYPSITGEPFRGTPTYLLFSPAGELLGVNPGPMKIEALERFMQRNAGG